MQIVRRELEMPFQCSRVRIERYHRVAVKIVALTLGAVVVGAGIARGPVQQPRLRIVGASQPRGGAAVLDRTSAPCFRTWLATGRDRPESPDALARCGSVRIEEFPNPFVDTRDA